VVGFWTPGCRAQAALAQPYRQTDLVVGRPEFGAFRIVNGAFELAGDPGALLVGPLPHHAPGPAAGEAVVGVLLRRVVQRQRILAALPVAAAGAGAVGARDRHRYAAARRPAVAEPGRIGVEQSERLVLLDGLPGQTVEAQCRPHLGAAALPVLEDDQGRFKPAGDAFRLP